MLIDLDLPASVPRTVREPAGRRWQVPVVVALLLLLLGASAPAANARLVPVTQTGRPAAASLLTTDALYTVHYLRDDRYEREISAWPLPPGGGPSWTARVVGDPKLVRSGTALIADAGVAGGLTVLDARTGRQRWRADPGGVTAVVGDRVAVSSPGRLRMVDAATGHTLWSRPADVSLLRAAGNRLVAIDPGYRATVLAADTGRVLSRDRDLGIDPRAWGLESPDAFTAVTVVGDQIYVYGAYEIRAFTVDGVTERWRASAGQPLSLFGCARGAICVPMPAEMAVLDPATGQIRWTDRRFRSLTADGIATDRDERSARLDPATGRVLRELGRGAVAGGLVLHPGRGRVLVTSLATGGLLGVLPPVTVSGCAVAGSYLACPASGRNYAVWRFTGP